MKSDPNFFIDLTILFLLFMLLIWLNGKVNVKKEIRYKQWFVPVFACLYTAGMMISMNSTMEYLMEKYMAAAESLAQSGYGEGAAAMQSLYESWGIYLELALFNLGVLLGYIVLKRVSTLGCRRFVVQRDTIVGDLVELFYDYDEADMRWYVCEHWVQAHAFLKSAFYVICLISGAAAMISYKLFMEEMVVTPFFPTFAVILLGELYYYLDGVRSEDGKSKLTVQFDRSNRITMYPLLRGPLKAIFGDKLSAEGTTVNSGSMTGGSVEEILCELDREGGHVGRNYAAFIRKKMDGGLKPNMDYVRCGYDLAAGKSLLFNTPFYDKLNPYVFYAMNRELLKGGKVLIVLGRHGTEEDLVQWSEEGMQNVTNMPGMWKISVLSDEKVNEDDLPDVGIISRSGVHNLDIHKNNREFLQKVSFVFVVEPSRLVTTAQIGLNLLIKCCGKNRNITFCSVDRNCDGLVDALSHILMTNITEVSATEYPHGTSSYMCWTADDEYIQHRILPGVSRYLGMGTELSMAALKNQVKRTVWYGGEAYPVMDARWISKQYYYDLLDYAQIPANQENFDKCFETSFNMCDERVSDYSYITVEDDRNNLFETRRNYATIAEKQGFVNVISSEYMLREYMSENTELFTADAKAIPYITADYARTKRNAILSLCLLLCVDYVQEEVLHRQMVMLNIDTKDPTSEIWKEICVIFGTEAGVDKKENPILCVKNHDGDTLFFEKDTTLLFKRAYSIESGKIENMYTIENREFSRIILDDLQHASYIAEQESEDVYIGTELKGHVYQKYLPGQFFTLNGKYYEMIHTTTDNRILVRRASEHIGGRLAYRQVRDYTIHHLEDAQSMGALKTVNDIDIHYQFADFSVETPGYWKLRAHNDFDHGDLVQVNGIPARQYQHKQILKFDFSKMGDKFTDSVRVTLTNLLNEVFVTLFADNQPFISAVTLGNHEAPLTYNLKMDEGVEVSDKCIYIIEDSQLDIGLLIAVERNVKRIFQIVSDYLAWNEDQIEASIKAAEEAEAEAAEEETKPESFDVYADDGELEEKKGFFAKLKKKIKSLFGRKKSKDAGTDGTETEEQPVVADEAVEDAPAEEVAVEETPVEPKPEVEVREDE